MIITAYLIDMALFNFKRLKPTNVVLRTSTPVDEFHFDTISPTHSGTDAVVVSNPIYALFNAQRLSSIGSFNVDEWIASMNNSFSDSLKELRKNIPDDQLCDYLKSRYCQKPSEISAWCEYLSHDMDKLTSEIRKYVESQSGSSADQSDDSSNSSSNTE